MCSTSKYRPCASAARTSCCWPATSCSRSSAQTPAARPAEEPTEQSYFGRYYGDQEQAEDEEADALTARLHLETVAQPHGMSAKSSVAATTSTTSTPHTAISAGTHHQHESPRPQSSDSHTRQKIAAMEEASRAVDNEVAIRQHISTSMKSLYRLSKSAGMDREEFASIVQTELSVLSMLDEEDH